ncbi:hypothetical protein JCM31447_11060 [Fluviispira sanaruensis]|uniref:Uncharacterized protein n=1 Tax=Fluviispira sanaruensis TaxID=2493639 RepID=A0A4P2VTG5_FLUSA|nr:hypothetical protein JCM31447_11060 [Fluviispira sanaruensis]
MIVEIKFDKQMQRIKTIINLNTSDLNESKQEKIQLKIINGKIKIRMSFKLKLME